MKSLKLVAILFLLCFPLSAFTQTDSFALSNLKVDYHILKVEYEKLLREHAIMEKMIKEETINTKVKTKNGETKVKEKTKTVEATKKAPVGTKVKTKTKTSGM